MILLLFPKDVIFLESALILYGYTDRISLALQIAMDINSEKAQYQIHYPQIDVFYMEQKLLELGIIGKTPAFE